MDTSEIVDQLDKSNGVCSRRKAIEWKKSLSKNANLREKRKNAIAFFNNPNMTTNMKHIQDAINSISMEEYKFKLNLKKEIAKYGEEP